MATMETRVCETYRAREAAAAFLGWSENITSSGTLREECSMDINNNYKGRGLEFEKIFFRMRARYE